MPVHLDSDSDFDSQDPQKTRENIETHRRLKKKQKEKHEKHHLINRQAWEGLHGGKQLNQP
jgi:DNA replication initiation complex subunit (GINS family)